MRTGLLSSDDSEDPGKESVMIRWMTTARVTHAALWVLAAVSPTPAFGCGPRGLPSNWLNRQLFESDYAYVYASTADTAKEAERLASKVASQFEDATGRNADKILIIVTCTNDTLLLADLEEMYELTFRRNMPSCQRRTERDLQHQRARMVRSKDVLLLQSFALSEQDLIEFLDLDSQATDQVAWAAAIPTKALIKESLKKTVNPAVDQMLDEEGIEGAKRVGAKMALNLKKWELKSKIEAKRDSVIYAAFVMSQPDVDENEKSKQIAAYWRWTRSGPSWLRESWPLQPPKRKTPVSDEAGAR